MKLVLDSSVVAKLFFEEEKSDSAIMLMEEGDEKDIEFISSDLIIYEVGNTIWKNLRKMKKNGISYIKLLNLLNIEYVPIDEELAIEALSLAQKKNITFYDGVHVALSKEYNATLVTEDRELLKKINNTQSIDGILNKIE
jgi:predicted nucleic acid-binding protein